MQTPNDINLNKPFFDAETANTTTGEINQGRKQWSMTTLYASRPSPRYATRAIAENWNKRYAGNAKLQVNPDDYPERQPEISPAQVDRNYQKLRDLTAQTHHLKMDYSKD